MYGVTLLAQACGALGDWPRYATLLGIVEAIGERTGGQPWPHEQATLDEFASRAAAALGPAMPRLLDAGRVLGREDQITAALWPSAPLGRKPGTGSGLSLTRREHQVADLMAEGLTNRQIAARLVIAERTVDTHVGRILAKLSCTNRTQAAVIIAATTAATAVTALPGGPSSPATR
jgi:non-specific serine/threonine protein kinase